MFHFFDRNTVAVIKFSRTLSNGSNELQLSCNVLK